MLKEKLEHKNLYLMTSKNKNTVKMLNDSKNVCYEQSVDASSCGGKTEVGTELQTLFTVSA